MATKTYCDECGEEIKDDSPGIFEPKNSNRTIEIIIRGVEEELNRLDLCKPCIPKELNKE